jgi:4-coumarate--CoA ligase
MAPKIYQSTRPRVPVFERSLVTHFFSRLDVAPRNQAAFVDAQTGTTITRGALRDLVLSFGYGLRQRKNIKKGETLMIYSPNCLAFPIVVLGCK